MAAVSVSVENVSKMFRLYHERNQHLKGSVLKGGRAKYEEFWAVNDVSFEVEAGKTLGIIGHNGSGKSTLLKCLARILVPEKGIIHLTGTMSALLELGAGFHPELSGRENIYLNGSILGMSKRDIAARFDDIVEFADLERFIDMPIKNYSSGMFARLGFAVAVNVDPDILIIDEVLSVGDAAFQRKSGEKIADFKRSGKTVIIVSHALPTVRVLCDEVVWLDSGKMVEVGPAAEVLDRYSGFSYEERSVSVDDTIAHPRHGSGEARFTKVELLGADDRSSLLHRLGDSLTIRLHYNAFERVKEPVFGIGINTLEGAVVFGPNTLSRSLHIDAIEGIGYVDFVMPEVLLNEGTYDLTVALMDRLLAHPYDFVTAIVRFDIRNEGHAEGGVIRHPGLWHMADRPIAKPGQTAI
jgi:ABC-type polysaccharide/polyol phosphate transport system ATPase subunit